MANKTQPTDINIEKIKGSLPSSKYRIATPFIILKSIK